MPNNPRKITNESWITNTTEGLAMDPAVATVVLHILTMATGEGTGGIPETQDGMVLRLLPTTEADPMDPADGNEEGIHLPIVIDIT